MEGVEDLVCIGLSVGGSQVVLQCGVIFDSERECVFTETHVNVSILISSTLDWFAKSISLLLLSA